MEKWLNVVGVISNSIVFLVCVFTLINVKMNTVPLLCVFGICYSIVSSYYIFKGGK